MRNGSLADLATMLQDQSARKHDLIVPSRAIHPFVTSEGRFGLFVDGADFGGVNEDGSLVEDVLTVFPNEICDEGISERLGIPIRYYRKMAELEPLLLVHNVQVWLDRMPDEGHLLRTFRTDEGAAIGRALLSTRYSCIDHLDVLFGILDGLREACPGATVSGADLTDRKMRIRVTAPEIAVNVAELVGNYSPRGSGRDPDDYPMLWSGFVAENSETGNAAWSLTPRAVFEICSNGLTRSVDAMRRIHLGGRMDEGVIDWSTETRMAQVELIRNQARDAVQTFLSVEYLERIRVDLYEASNIAIARPVHAVEHVRRTLAFSPEQGESILAHFLGSGDESALGLAQAISWEAKSIEDDDLAADLEAGALNAALMAAGAFR